VCQRDRLVAEAAGGGDGWPFNHQRHAHAAFVARSLAGAQRRVVSDRNSLAGLSVCSDISSVVAVEDDQRVLRKFPLVEMRQNSADALVETADHRGVDGILMMQAGLQF